MQASRLFQFTAGLLCSVAAIMAQNSPSQGLPPLIDRELLFGNPEISMTQLSPDGKYLAFLKPYKDTRNVWVKKIDQPFSEARLLTTETKRPIGGYLWTRDSKFIVYVKDSGGDENFNIYAVNPAAAKAEGSDAPPSKDLTGLKGVRVMLYDAPKKRPDVLYIGLNDRDKAWHDLYELNIATGERKLIKKNTERIAEWNFDLDGNLRLAMHAAPNGDQVVMQVTPDGFKKVYSCNVFESCGVLRAHKDGKRFYMETNKGADIDLSELILFDPATGKVEKVESDPLKKVDFGGIMFSNVTDELVMTSYMEDKVRHYFRDKAVEADYAWLEKKVPGRQINVGSRTDDESVWLVSANGDTEPGEVFLFDRKAKKLTLQYKVRENLPRTSLSSMKPIRYKSSDGLEIPAYLTLPKGLPEKNLPLIVFPHGGPWGRDVWGFHPYAQFLANRGYAVLMPNFRASTGYGKKFLDAGNGEWGKKMQDDLTWGVKHLIAQGIADPKRVGIMGGSYGGYATLAGVAFTPDVYRAGVDIVGPSNLITLLEAIPPYWESGKKIMYSRMADLETAEGKAWLKDRSPLTAADKIKTPLLVVQGANDPRVNQREAEQIVVALRDRGFKVEYILAPDEGHGFQRPVNNMAMLMAAERFLAENLDGRYQKDGKPEVVARLKEITVDPKSVVITKPKQLSESAGMKIAHPPTAGTLKYVAKIAMGGNEMEVKTSSTIAEEKGQWVATDTMETPMGPVTDRAVLEKYTLELIARSVQQGPVSVNVDFADGKAKGKMSMNGQDRNIDVDMGGPAYPDSAGSTAFIAALPLSDGYSTTYRSLDLMKQKPRAVELKVTGSEKITVPAGESDCWKVELNDGAGFKADVWVSKASPKVIKTVVSAPQMGGAKITSELTN